VGCGGSHKPSQLENGLNLLVDQCNYNYTNTNEMPPGTYNFKIRKRPVWKNRAHPKESIKLDIVHGLEQGQKLTVKFKLDTTPRSTVFACSSLDLHAIKPSHSGCRWIG
jgi:hypothetical protein